MRVRPLSTPGKPARSIYDCGNPARGWGAHVRRCAQWLVTLCCTVSVSVLLSSCIYVEAGGGVLAPERSAGDTVRGSGFLGVGGYVAGSTAVLSVSMGAMSVPELSLEPQVARDGGSIMRAFGAVRIEASPRSLPPYLRALGRVAVILPQPDRGEGGVSGLLGISLTRSGSGVLPDRRKAIAGPMFGSLSLGPSVTYWQRNGLSMTSFGFHVMGSFGVSTSLQNEADF